MLLESLGLHVGKLCRNYWGLRHFRIPKGWYLQHQEHGFVVFDNELRARLSFDHPPDEDPRLVPIAYHRFIATWRQLEDDKAVVCGDLTTADGDTVLHVFRVVPVAVARCDRIIPTFQALVSDVVSCMPDAKHPLAYWK